MEILCKFGRKRKTQFHVGNIFERSNFDLIVLNAVIFQPAVGNDSEVFAVCGGNHFGTVFFCGGVFERTSDLFAVNEKRRGGGKKFVAF